MLKYLTKHQQELDMNVVVLHKLKFFNKLLVRQLLFALWTEYFLDTRNKEMNLKNLWMFILHINNMIHEGWNLCVFKIFLCVLPEITKLILNHRVINNFNTHALNFYQQLLVIVTTVKLGSDNTQERN